MTQGTAQGRLRRFARRLRDPQFFVALAGGTLFGALLLRGDGETAAWQRILSVGLLQPVVEEIVFRGLVQPGLRRAAWARRAVFGFSVANAVTSLLFGAAHLVYHDPAWAAAVIVPSLIFGYFRDRHGGIFSPVILHIAFNLSLLL